MLQRTDGTLSSVGKRKMEKEDVSVMTSTSISSRLHQHPSDWSRDVRHRRWSRSRRTDEQMGADTFIRTYNVVSKTEILRGEYS